MESRSARAWAEFATALEASGYGKIEEIGFDVFLPTYQQQPNTTFLAGTGLLDKEGRIEATSCLQSKARPEVFGAGVTNIPLLGHPASARVAAQAVTCVHNARLFLDGYEPTELAPHLDRLIPPIEPLPSIINIGHGKGAHAIWAEHTAYYPPALLCMRPCKGGFLLPAAVLLVHRARVPHMLRLLRRRGGGGGDGNVCRVDAVAIRDEEDVGEGSGCAAAGGDGDE